MLLNFKILAFFWRQFYQEKGGEWAGQNGSKTTTPSKSSKGHQASDDMQEMALTVMFRG